MPETRATALGVNAADDFFPAGVVNVGDYDVGAVARQPPGGGGADPGRGAGHYGHAAAEPRLAGFLSSRCTHHGVNLAHANIILKYA
jgi:hypothetical protein